MRKTNSAIQDDRNWFLWIKSMIVVASTFPEGESTSV